jgi:hypothetical protein
VGWFGALILILATLDTHPSSVRLVFERQPGAESCPGEEAIRAAVVGRLGVDPFDSESKKVIRCTMGGATGRLEARIEVVASSTSRPATRELVSKRSDCIELGDAVVLALSIAINPRFAAGPAKTSAATELSAAPEPPPPTPLPEVPARTPAARAPAASPPTVIHATPVRGANEFAVGVEGGAATGLAPGAAAVSAGFGIAARRGAFSLGLDGRLVGPSSTRVTGGTLEAWLWNVSLAPCFHQGAFAGCGVIAAGALNARGDGFALSNETINPYLGLGGRGVFQYPHTGRLRLRVTGEIAFPLVITHLVVDGGDAWVSPRVSAALNLGLVAVFF